MKLHKEDRGMTSEGQSMRSGQYTIQASSKMFKMLSDGVYKDKLLAPIRELVANAMDELRMVKGKGRLPEVRLPTILSPEVVVKDFGRGMDEDTVMELYTTYGYSTKDNVNVGESGEIIGGFGIGSKSPFAYTDTFTIESRYDGMISTYAAHLDNVGMPSIVKITSVPTVEPNGLTVKFPVNREDVGRCQEKLEKVCEFYDPPPIVKGSDTFEVPKQDYIIDRREKGYAIKKANHHYSGEKNRIILGNNALPFDLQMLNLPYGDTLKYDHMDLWMPMGTVDVAVSREELSYDEVTIKNIVDHLKMVEEDMVKEFTKDLKKISNKHERSKALGDAVKGSVTFRRIKKELAEEIDCDHTVEIKVRGAKQAECYYSDYSNLKLRKVETRIRHHYDSNKDVYFVIVDESKACDIRTRQWIKKTFTERRDKQGDSPPFPYVYQIQEKDWKEVKKAFGNPLRKYIVKTSEIDYTPVASARKARGEVVTYNWDAYLGVSSVYKSTVDAGKVLDGKYLVIDNQNITINGVKYSREFVFPALISGTRGISYVSHLIYKSSIPFVDELGWEEDSEGFLEYLKECVEDYQKRLDSTSLQQFLSNSNQIKEWEKLVDSPDLSITPYNKEIVEETREAIKALSKIQKDPVTGSLCDHTLGWGYKLNNTTIEVCNKILSDNKVKLDYENEFTKAIKLIESKHCDTISTRWEASFPMLEHTGLYQRNNQEVIDYVNKWVG